MSYNAYDINVLVNGRRCKQYVHEGKIYIESKDGSNYTLEIKNNTGQRILVVSSVDGLNVLNGESASPADTGYVVDPYSKVEIKGFRYTDENVGAFEFTQKRDNDSYAASKGDQRNCGVIGFRLYNEIWRPVWQNITYTYPKPQPWPIWNDPFNPIWTTCGGMTRNYDEILDCDITYGSCNDSGTKGAPTKGPEWMSGQGSKVKTQGLDNSNVLRSYNPLPRKFSLGESDVVEESKPRGFDMATKWGEKLTSKVTNVNFDRGCLVQSLDIYYASRKSLIQMGVPIDSHQKVAAPESFPGTYAKPPKGWRG